MWKLMHSGYQNVIIKIKEIIGNGKHYSIRRSI